MFDQTAHYYRESRQARDTGNAGATAVQRITGLRA